MNREVELLVAEDDPGHAGLIRRNLVRSGIANSIRHFCNGQEVLDFFQSPGEQNWQEGKAYVLLLDIRMPKVGGVEVLRQLKAHPDFRKIPVIMITTTQAPEEIEECYALGCSNYITKPVDYDNFVNAIRNLGLFLTIVEVPQIHPTAEGSADE